MSEINLSLAVNAVDEITNNVENLNINSTPAEQETQALTDAKVQRRRSHLRRRHYRGRRRFSFVAVAEDNNKDENLVSSEIAAEGKENDPPVEALGASPASTAKTQELEKNPVSPSDLADDTDKKKRNSYYFRRRRRRSQYKKQEKLKAEAVAQSEVSAVEKVAEEAPSNPGDSVLVVAENGA